MLRHEDFYTIQVSRCVKARAPKSMATGLFFKVLALSTYLKYVSSEKFRASWLGYTGNCQQLPLETTCTFHSRMTRAWTVHNRDDGTKKITAKWAQFHVGFRIG